MKLIGIKRLILLMILIGLNAFIAASYFLWIEPMRGEAQTKLTGLQSDISSLQNKIQNTKTELAEYATNLPKYQALQGRGFMSSQDRFQITRDLDDVRKRADMGNFSFRIDDLRNVENADAAAANMKVINSRINVENVGSLLDINIYNYIDLMANSFPSHVRINSFKIERKEKLTPQILLKIADTKGVNVSLVNASAVFDWLTYVPLAAPADPNNPNAPRR